MEAMGKIMLCILMAMTMGLLCTESRDPVMHRVGGGKYTWAPNINYTEWASHEHFYTGDWLYFGFNKTLYNVLEVNRTSYDNCNERDFIKNITKGGRDVFQLLDARPYYFISGKGFCSMGMRVEVNVEQAAPTPPSPSAAIVTNKALPSSTPQSSVKFLILVPTILALTTSL